MSLVANDSCVEPRFAPMSQSDDWIIRQAIALLEQRVFKKGPSLERPAAVKDYLRLKLAAGQRRQQCVVHTFSPESEASSAAFFLMSFFISNAASARA